MHNIDIKKLNNKIFSLSKNKVLTIILALLLTIAILITLYQANTDWKREIDYDEFINSSKALLSHQNPYEKSEHFIYPLFISVLLIPISYMPRVIQFMLWTSLNIACFLFSTKMLLEIFSKSYNIYLTNIQKIFFISLSGIFLFIGLQTNLRLGQVNLLILFLTILFLRFHLENKPFLSSMFLAIGISIKLLPLFLLLFVLIEKRYKTFIFSLVFSFILIFVFPFLLIKSSQIISFYGYYLNDFFLSDSLTFDNSILFLPFLISRVSLDSMPFLLCYILSLLIIIIPMILIFIGELLDRRKIEPLIIFNLCIISILLLTPRLQSHYLTYLLSVIIMMKLMLCNCPTKICIINLILLILLLFGVYTYKLSKIPIYISLYSLYVYLLFIGGRNTKTRYKNAV